MARALLAIIVLGAGCGFQLTPGTDVVADARPVDAPGDGGVGVDSPIDSAIDAEIDAPGTTPVVTFEGASSGSVSYASPLVAQHTVGAGSNRLLLVGLSTSYAGTTALTVSYGALPLTRVGVRDAAALDGRVELWSLVNPPVGTANLTVVLSDLNSTVVAGMASFTGVSAVAPIGTLSTNIGTTGSPNVVVASGAGELVLGFVMFNGSYTTLVPAATQTARWTAITDRIIGAGSTRAGTTVTTLTWSVANNANDYWATAAIAIK